MNELAHKIAQEKNTYVAEILGQPFLGTIMGRLYNLHIRPLRDLPNGGRVKHSKAEIILRNEKIIPVIVVGSSMVEPVLEAFEKEIWTADDESIYIQENDLTPDEVSQVRWFIQRQ